MLCVCLRGYFHSDACMRTAVVVEDDEEGETLMCVVYGLETLLSVYDLGLENGVYADLTALGIYQGFTLYRLL